MPGGDNTAAHGSPGDGPRRQLDPTAHLSDGPADLPAADLYPNPFPSPNAHPIAGSHVDALPDP